MVPWGGCPALGIVALLLASAAVSLAMPAFLLLAALAFLAASALGALERSIRRGGAAPYGGAVGTRSGHRGGCRRGLLVISETQLFEREHLTGPGEGGQNNRIGNVVGGAAKARVVAVKEAEDKPGILDGFADVPKSGGRELEFQAVLIDRRVTLLQGVKLLNQEDSPGCAVGAEEAFNGHPQLAGGLVLIGEGQIKDGVIDSVQDPTADGALSNVPRWINRRRSRPSDVWEKTEFPTQGLEERSRLGEVGGFSSPRPPGCGSSHWR